MLALALALPPPPPLPALGVAARLALGEADGVVLALAQGEGVLEGKRVREGKALLLPVALGQGEADVAAELLPRQVTLAQALRDSLGEGESVPQELTLCAALREANEREALPVSENDAVAEGEEEAEAQGELLGVAQGVALEEGEEESRQEALWQRDALRGAEALAWLLSLARGLGDGAPDVEPEGLAGALGDCEAQGEAEEEAPALRGAESEALEEAQGEALRVPGSGVGVTAEEALGASCVPEALEVAMAAVERDGEGRGEEEMEGEWLCEAVEEVLAEAQMEALGERRPVVEAQALGGGLGVVKLRVTLSEREEEGVCAVLAEARSERKALPEAEAQREARCEARAEALELTVGDSGTVAVGRRCEGVAGGEALAAGTEAEASSEEGVGKAEGLVLGKGEALGDGVTEAEGAGLKVRLPEEL